MKHEAWTIEGADGQPILGNTHEPDADAVAVMIICHGFKGYKDYGFLPYLAAEAAKRRIVAHRFNFSHSGMTNRLETFERPDLFEHDTWGKQIHDLQALCQAIEADQLRGRGLPMTWFGHSRGGVTVALTAARAYENDEASKPAGVIMASAPSSASILDDDQSAALRKLGYLDSPSSRTGQVLRVGRAWLDEIDAEPDAFDPLLAIRRIACPVLLIHGEVDETVPVEAAHRYVETAGPNARLHVIRQGNHVFNGRNPLPMDEEPPIQLQQMVKLSCDFALTRTGRIP